MLYTEIKICVAKLTFYVLAVATVTAIPNGSILGSESSIPTVRPVYPRTQYTMPYASTPRVNAAELTQPSSGNTQVDRKNSHCCQVVKGILGICLDQWNVNMVQGVLQY